ncbi:hypothetical protein [Paraburkholderia megapolitana]|uniref:hypothetical protein n=1 Tax=Paraburkholderia megapolitana TaxID=420953 RepID=UPI0038BA474C
MVDLATVLPANLPAAIAWAEAQSQLVLNTGAPLTESGIADAKTVGVTRPELIRVLVVPHMPLPDDAALRAIALDTGLLGPDAIGLTLGHAIFIVEGHESRQLLTHECRHVHQYETAGSIAAFLPVYFQQLVTVGYYDAPFEVDAREHEID